MGKGTLLGTGFLWGMEALVSIGVPVGQVGTGTFLGTGVPTGHKDTLRTWGYL